MKKFGHDITFVDNEVVYADNHEQVNMGNTANVHECPSTRKCPTCNLPPTKDGHDPCIANLPGVHGACCGHGVSEGYIRFKTGHVIRGMFTITHTKDY